MGHREELLAAARRLLEQQGFAHITTRDLVAESGTNLASIGYHFGSKAALLHLAVEAAFEDWADQLGELVMADPGASPIERAWTAWSAVLAALPQRRAMLAAYVEALAQAQRDPDLQRQLALHLDRVRTKVATRVAVSLGGDHSATDERCQAIASFVIAVCDGLSVQYLLDPVRTPTGPALLDGLMTVFQASAPALSGAPGSPTGPAE